MVYVRKSVWASGGDFSDPILYWYAIGVGELQKRPLADKTGWRFMAAIHGFNAESWGKYGYYSEGEALPSKAELALYWQQCQHQSWYFLPWHRGYIWSIESLLRDAIIKKGGPADWAMPYWNYSDTHEKLARMLPPAFARQTMPDGSPNPLYIVQRWGLGTTPIMLPADDVTLQALKVPNFTGVAFSSLSGFGGIKTGFSHSGRVSGQLESVPHNVVHVDIGGQQDDDTLGLMSDPDTAGLDPIFWLHHANIDRLWEVWNASNPKHTNPTDPAWLNGPLDRKFVVPAVGGGDYVFTPAQMLHPSQEPLNYIYDEVDNIASGTAARAVPASVALAAVAAAPAAEGLNVAADKPSEVVGANTAALSVTGVHSKTRVQLDRKTAHQVFQSFRSALTEAASPAAGLPGNDQVLLHLENIRAARDGQVIQVYLNLPEGAKPEDCPDRLAGVIALFGVRKASQPDQPHGGMGISEVLDVTDTIAALERSGELDGGDLDVSLVPRTPVSEQAKVTVERVSLIRQPK